MSPVKFEEQYAALMREIEALEARLAKSETGKQLADIKRRIDDLIEKAVTENTAKREQLTSIEVQHDDRKSIFTALSDLPEHMGVEELLREDLRILETVLENVATPIYAKRKDGRYIYINHEMEYFCKVTREQAIGKTDFELFPREIAEGFRTNDLNAMAAGKVLVSEEKVDSALGERLVLSKKAPLISSGG